jgi:hypothetical protein
MPQETFPRIEHRVERLHRGLTALTWSLAICWVVLVAGVGLLAYWIWELLQRMP